MSRKLQIALVILILVFVIGLAVLILRDAPDDPFVQRLASPAASPAVSGFARADGVQEINFPADHGPHPDFQTEWWYYTGNLEDEDGRRFGFQLTFFRRALQPPSQTPERQSGWATEQVYMAHFAISDIGEERFWAFERLSRGAAGLAGSQPEPFRVWLDDWQVEQISPSAACPEGSSPPCAYRLNAAQEGISLELDLLDAKGPVLQGESGYSQKGAEPGQASYYYSLTRLQATGRVKIGDEVFEVSGLSWMDHEWSTSALSIDQVGWDWFSLQLDDGSELMLFQIRRSDGSIDPFSSGALIAADGSSLHLKRDDFEIAVTNTWTSPHSGALYPAGWRLSVPSAQLELQINPLMNDQELNVSYAYWEGAVRALGLRAGGEISGYGYVELTGYSGSMGGEF